MLVFNLNIFRHLATHNILSYPSATPDNTLLLPPPSPLLFPLFSLLFSSSSSSFSFSSSSQVPFYFHDFVFLFFVCAGSHNCCVSMTTCHIQKMVFHVAPSHPTTSPSSYTVIHLSLYRSFPWTFFSMPPWLCLCFWSPYVSPTYSQT